MKKLLQDFRDFIMTGNVIDLSVAVILATAVGAVIAGFTDGIMMPFVGHFVGGADFSDLKFVLSEAVMGADGEISVPENAILYGEWINTVINLLIVGFVLFMIVKTYQRIQDLRKTEEVEEEEAPAGPTQEELLAEIRDELKNLNAK